MTTFVICFIVNIFVVFIYVCDVFFFIFLLLLDLAICPSKGV